MVILDDLGRRKITRAAFCDSNISMNHDMTKTEREETKHLVDKAREMNKQDHMGE